MNETAVTVVGNLITEPTMKRLAEDNCVAHFRVASTERRFDKVADQWVDGDSLFVNVTCWRRLAASVAASLRKGDPVIVSGRLSTRTYEVEGQRRWSTNLVAQALGPDLSKCGAEVRRHRREQSGAGVAGPDTAATGSSGGAESTATAAGGGEFAA
ncbi:MAG: single-stranded DNA-binding protein [Sciscionella sp.]